MLYAARAPKPSSELDFNLMWLTIGLLAIGLVMVYSASIAIAEAAKYTGGNGEYYLLRQGIFIAIGVMVGVGAFQIPTKVWQQAAPYLFLAGLLLLLVVLIPGIGREVNGSRRWIPLGFANLQPSELMKFLAVLYAADYTTRKAAFMHDFKKGFLPMAGVMMLAGALLLREPDFGAFVVIISIAMGILFLGGLNWKVFAGLVVVLLIGFVLLIGRDAPLIAAAIEGCKVETVRVSSLAEAVEQAQRLAHPGDAVLLSPACASFDMFRNYTHRAEVFIAAVNKLAAERGAT
jgi:cell division protein FtsW